MKYICIKTFRSSYGKQYNEGQEISAYEYGKLKYPENFNFKQKEGLGTCKEKGCERVATKDYNGHGHYVCEQHYESLSNYFDEEYK